MADAIENVQPTLDNFEELPTRMTLKYFGSFKPLHSGYIRRKLEIRQNYDKENKKDE